MASLEVPEFTAPDPADEKKLANAKIALSELPDALEELADALDAQCDEADNAEFPGMMG